MFYSLDVECWKDSSGNGVGDFSGLIDRLDYLDWLGIDALWLLPFFPSPNRDDGYDVADYYSVDPRIGSLEEFDRFVEAARRRGIRVVIDLVVNHTSDQHPWFQEARSDPTSSFRSWYVWTQDPSRVPSFAPQFPGEQEGSWTWDDRAGAYYLHRFYQWQPDLNVSNPAVCAEIQRIMEFWLARGVSGFRVDAAPMLIETIEENTVTAGRLDALLPRMRSVVERWPDDPILLAEANVSPEETPIYFGEQDRMPMVFGFLANQWSFLAHARRDGSTLAQFFSRLTEDLPEQIHWLHFLRHHDELNLDQLGERERQEVLEALAPDPHERIYGRGIRRRLMPMFDGDRDRVEMAHALSFALPGTPLIRYGEEIGMGDDLSLPGRMAVRTAMQWSGDHNGGFSTAKRDGWPRPVIDDGPYSYRRVNVESQSRDRGSLLSFIRRLVRVRKEQADVIGHGTASAIAVEPRSVLAHRVDSPAGALVFAHQLGETEIEIRGLEEHLRAAHQEVLVDSRSAELAAAGQRAGSSRGVRLGRYGFRWWRLF